MAAVTGAGEADRGEARRLQGAVGEVPGETVKGWSCWPLPIPPATGRCIPPGKSPVPTQLLPQGPLSSGVTPSYVPTAGATISEI